ncbi:DUF2502 domain-containing protein [Samsonia erythrinae]|uniref:Uncharacterized protein DUF2502 n=1 Tax=Samsonia erythrinae TaxID=160434 RepID=A0A4R3VL69_9GAMM|nr:DUF2502 domain-containing protein [Samsonia erythrinae]TCV04624.1 uncharacterized protein DUF2502 [Samsonia erythrinae]
MFKPLVISTLFMGMFAIMPAAEADSIRIDLLPGVTLNIGDRDKRGRYWDGYDWRSERWWHQHRGYHRGERNRHGHYWDGWRWRDARWWHENLRDRRGDDKRRFEPSRYDDDRGPRRADGDRRGHERRKDDYRNGRGAFRD